MTFRPLVSGLALSACMMAAGGVAAAPSSGASGVADLNGVWTNVSITPFERSATYGDRRAHTPQEAKAIEGAAVERFEEGNAPTDPNQGAEDQTSKKCTSAGGLDCGYNSGWKDSGISLTRVNGEPRTSFITTGNGRIPARKADAAPAPSYRDAGPRTDNPEDRALGERCLTSFGFSAGPVMLPLMYNNNYQFVQTKDDVAIVVEMVHDVRHIRIGATEHLPSTIRPWFGDSIGHWEGKTLVSETTNFHPDQAKMFRGADANLKVVEKFTRVGPKRMLYQFTVTDPTIWAQPWGGEYEFTASDAPLYEYACHEGNYALHNILAGARAEERKTAGGQKVAASGTR